MPKIKLLLWWLFAQSYELPTKSRIRIQDERQTSYIKGCHWISIRWTGLSRQRFWKSCLQELHILWSPYKFPCCRERRRWCWWQWLQWDRLRLLVESKQVILTELLGIQTSTRAQKNCQHEQGSTKESRHQWGKRAHWSFEQKTPSWFKQILL